VKPFDKPAFSRIANDGIYAKWSDKVLSGLITSLFRLMVPGPEFFPELCSLSVGFIKSGPLNHYPANRQHMDFRYPCPTENE